jgi:hypothetical protein
MDMPQVLDRDTYPTTYKCVGSCSVCAGPVLVAERGTSNSAPKCDHCGATARTTYGPTIDMIPAGDMRRAWSDMNEEQRNAALNMGALSD